MLSIYEWSILCIFVYFVLCYLILSQRFSKKVFVSITTVHLIIITGLRATSVGTDLVRYERHFDSLRGLPISELLNHRFELGYQFVTYIFANTFFSFNLFLLVISVFNFIVLGYIIYKFSTQPFFSFLLYFIFGIYDFNLSGLRQSIAMTIILISFLFLMNESKLKYIISIVVASLFHSTAILFLVVYPLMNKKINVIYRVFYPLLFVFFIIFNSFLSNLAESFFGLEVSNALVTLELNTTTITFLFVFILGLFIKLFVKISDEKLLNSLLVLSSLSVLIQILSTSSYLFTRLNMYYYQFIIILFPIIYNAIIYMATKSKYDSILIRYVASIVFILLVLMYYNSYLGYNPHQILPHYFFWEI